MVCFPFSPSRLSVREISLNTRGKRFTTQFTLPNNCMCSTVLFNVIVVSAICMYSRHRSAVKSSSLFTLGVPAMR